MISGFNTDVECAGTVYHVQTEDKGAPHNVIMSLVYNQGTILASKREPYDTATAENVLKDRVNKQHKLICAAVKAGRIDDLKQMTAARRKGSSAAKSNENVHPVAETEQLTIAPLPPPLPIKVDAPITRPQLELQPAVIASSPVTADPIFVAAPARPPQVPAVELRSPADAPLDESPDSPIIEAVEVVEEYAEILPAEAVEVVSELSGQSRPSHQKLGIELIGDSRFRGGDRKMVNLMVCRGSDRKVVPGAQIMIKILGSAFRPVIFHARSDQNGLSKVHLQVPQFTAGRAALLIRAIADGEEVELRRVVTAGS